MKIPYRNKPPRRDGGDGGDGVHRGAPNRDEGERYRRSSYRGNRQVSRQTRTDRTPVRRVRRKPEERAILVNGKIDYAALEARSKKLVKAVLSRIFVDREDLIKAGVIAIMLIFFALLQTTVFTRLPPFGAVPDLMLAFVIAVAVAEGERWGSVVALFAALTVSSIGTVVADVIPLIYFISAYIAGVLSRYYLRKNALIRLVYQVVAGFLRGIGTAVMLAVVSRELTFHGVMLGTIIPEYFSTLVTAPFVHIIVAAALMFFHRSRDQRTETSVG